MSVPPAKKRGLGRGLDALLPNTPPSAAASPSPEPQPRQVLIGQLRPNRLQPRTRFSDAEVEELATSIRAQGMIQPILVTPSPEGGYMIVAGERRFRAAQRLGLEQVPVVVREVANDRELLELALVENLQRSDLDPVEEAEAYKTLQQAFGLSQEVIAERVGKSRPAVANALRLLRLPPTVLELLRERRLSVGQVRPLLTISSPTEQDRLARRIVEQGLSARAVEAAVGPREARDSASNKPGDEPAAPEAHAADAAERLTRHLQTRVEIRRRGAGGEIRIGFHAEDELIRLFEALMGRAEPAP